MDLPGRREASRGGFIVMKLVVPPSCGPAGPTILIGRNRFGNWVVREQNGLFGGLFANRADAIKQALFENGHNPDSIVEVSQERELDILWI